MTKTNAELIKIWKENEKNTYKGVTEYNNLTPQERIRIFDLIADGEHIK